MNLTHVTLSKGHNKDIEGDKVTMARYQGTRSKVSHGAAKLRNEEVQIKGDSSQSISQMSQYARMKIEEIRQIGLSISGGTSRKVPKPTWTDLIEENAEMEGLENKTPTKLVPSINLPRQQNEVEELGASVKVLDITGEQLYT
ncbi:hypothetical protein LIER_31370 [Lithospermum erythrorhizon]|uniref:Uncharacterized protein n=1 Tax=Lithospermum erythrorhizon TaxID=34254 RepID=A0AAV3RWP0_LITER